MGEPKRCKAWVALRTILAGDFDWRIARSNRAGESNFEICVCKIRCGHSMFIAARDSKTYQEEDVFQSHEMVFMLSVVPGGISKVTEYLKKTS